MEENEKIEQLIKKYQYLYSRFEKLEDEIKNLKNNLKPNYDLLYSNVVSYLIGCGYCGTEERVRTLPPIWECKNCKQESPIKQKQLENEEQK